VSVPTYGASLASDIAALLKSEGYPRLSLGDFEDLQQALRGFLYGPRQHTQPDATSTPLR
jgi:hypothetical protein